MDSDNPTREVGARPPRDDLVRALPPRELELRDDADGPPVMKGYFSRFGVWNEIDSVFEGQFMERIAPSAFTKTFEERTPKVLFEHGQDPELGNKPLGVPDVLEIRRKGPYYEVPLFKGVPDLVVSGLRAGSYGASYRFSVQRENFNRDAKPSEYNPKGLPERTLLEVSVPEFGPVVFPADPGASASVRSLTDEFMARRLVAGGLTEEMRDELLRSLEVTRMDTEDLSTLAQMIDLATMYIAEQDEPADQANVPVMEDVLRALASLVPVEVAEDEGAEPDDETSSTGRSAPPPDAAPEGTSDRDAAHVIPPWPKTPPDVWEGLWTP
jgi:phage head maturation protease